MLAGIAGGGRECRVSGLRCMAPGLSAGLRVQSQTEKSSVLGPSSIVTRMGLVLCLAHPLLLLEWALFSIFVGLRLPYKPL